MEFKKKRWLYLAAAMVLALCSGIGYTWSVFQKPLMDNFDWALKTISLTFTIQVMVSTLFPIVIGGLQKKIGTKNYIRLGIAIYTLGLVATMFTPSIGYLYIVFGVIVGIGISILYPCLIAYSTSLFPDKTGMASGMLACAYGAGAILWAPTATFIMGKYGILNVFGFFGVLFAVVMIPVSFVIKNIPEGYTVVTSNASKASGSQYEAKDYTWREMIRTPRYYLLVLTLTLGATAGLMIMAHLSGILQESQHMTAEKAALLLGLTSIFNASGRFLFGFISDKMGRYNVMILLFGILCGSMVLLTKASGLLFVAGILAIGSCYGGFTSMFSPICADNFGMKNLSVNYAFLYIAYGFGGFVGPQLAARVKTASGGYEAAFMIVAAMCIAGIGLSVYMKNQVERNSKKNVERIA